MPLFMVAAILFWPTVIGTGFYFLRRYVRAIEHRAGSGATLDAISERLLRVEESLETTRAEMARIDEGNEFTQRLLSERSSARRDPPA